MVLVEAGALRLAEPVADAEPATAARAAPLPPPAVIFSAPLADDIDVPPDTTVRVQFSRDMDPDSFDGNVRVRYAGPSADGDEADGPAFETTYRGRNRVLELRPRGGARAIPFRAGRPAGGDHRQRRPTAGGLVALVLHGRLTGPAASNCSIAARVRATSAFRWLASISAASIGGPKRHAHRDRPDEGAALPHRGGRPLNGHRDDRRLPAHRHEEAALLEGKQGAGAAAGAFRKDHERVAARRGRRRRRRWRASSARGSGVEWARSPPCRRRCGARGRTCATRPCTGSSAGDGSRPGPCR